MRSTGVYHEQKVFYVADPGNGKPTLVSNFIPPNDPSAHDYFYGSSKQGNLIINPDAYYVDSGLADGLKKALRGLYTIAEQVGVGSVQNYLDWNDLIPQWDPDINAGASGTAAEIESGTLTLNMTNAINSLIRGVNAYLYPGTGKIDGYYASFVAGAKESYMHSNLHDSNPPYAIALAYSNFSYSGALSSGAWTAFPPSGSASLDAIRVIFSEPMDSTTLSSAISITGLSGSTEVAYSFDIVNHYATSGNGYKGDMRTFVAYNIAGASGASTFEIDRDNAKDLAGNLLRDMVSIKFTVA